MSPATNGYFSAVPRDECLTKSNSARACSNGTRQSTGTANAGLGKRGYPLSTIPRPVQATAIAVTNTAVQVKARTRASRDATRLVRPQTATPSVPAANTAALLLTATAVAASAVAAKKSKARSASVRPASTAREIATLAATTRSVIGTTVP